MARPRSHASALETPEWIMGQGMVLERHQGVVFKKKGGWMLVSMKIVIDAHSTELIKEEPAAAQ